jgi:hypothetical protein
MQNSNNELVTRTNGNRLALPERSMTPVSVAEHLELTVREVKDLLASADADNCEYLRWAYEMTKDSAATVSAKFDTHCVTDPTGRIIAQNSREINISKDKNNSW